MLVFSPSETRFCLHDATALYAECVCVCVCVLRLLVLMGCKYEYTNVRTNQCEHEYVLSFHLEQAYGVKWKIMAPLCFLFILLLLSRLKQQPSRTHNSSNPRKIK